MKKIIVVGVILLFLGSSVPALAKTQSSLSKTIPLISASLADDYKVFIGAGIFREQGGKFGLGWHMTVVDTGDKNVTGVFYDKETTLSGKVISNGSGPFSIIPGIGVSTGACSFLDLHPIELINLTVQIGNMTYSKSGYEIGPFVLLVG